MKQFNTTQRALLDILKDGNCHSGSALGLCLGISRSAIWKHIKQLTDLGVPIVSHAHQGYQLNNGFTALNAQEIAAHLLARGFADPYELHLFSSIDSTNRYLKDLPLTDKVAICCAELQTQGRGRFNRQWHSPFGENIYLSSRWNLHCDLSRLSGLSLVVSLAIVATLNEIDANSGIQIKWPNDLLWLDKKLSGSLIEINAESNAHAQVIIGIGLNVNSDTKNHPLPDKLWCSLYEIFGRPFNRNPLLASLLVHLNTYLTQFITQGLSVFIEEWHRHDYLAGKCILVNQSSQTLRGTARGITSEGLLILEDSSGKNHYLASGDTSLSKLD